MLVSTLALDYPSCCLSLSGSNQRRRRRKKEEIEGTGNFTGRSNTRSRTNGLVMYFLSTNSKHNDPAIHRGQPGYIRAPVRTYSPTPRVQRSTWLTFPSRPYTDAAATKQPWTRSFLRLHRQLTNSLANYMHGHTLANHLAKHTRRTMAGL